MTKPRFLTALTLFNAAAFLIASLFLPSPGSYSYSNPISQYINSRTGWNEAFVALFASLLISWGIYLLLRFREPNHCSEK